MLIFHRPDFLKGSIKVEDVKVDEQGQPVFKSVTKAGSLVDVKGKSIGMEKALVYWHLTPDMRGKVVEFNDEAYVLKKYPNLFFKTDDDIKKFEQKKAAAAKARDRRKADEWEATLQQALDDGEIEQHYLDEFKKERKRLDK